jgi:Domain of unknown function (DUF4411)
VPDREPDVWLIDASAIINTKKAVPANKQWALFRRWEAMVEAGTLAFPKQVKTEVTEVAHPDAPGVWADGVFPSMRHPVEPAPQHIRRVMASAAAAVVDPNKTREDGDPYLIAMALQLASTGHACRVVTDDTKDNPTRIAVSTACELLRVDWCCLHDFLAAIGFANQPSDT